MDLNQITIPSTNLTKSVDFYKKLGLILIVDALPNYARFKCPDGSSTFSISSVKKLSPSDGIKIYFEEKNLDDFVSELQQKGIEFISDPEDKPWLWREAHLYDPDGHHLILFHAAENRKNPPWRI